MNKLVFVNRCNSNRTKENIFFSTEDGINFWHDKFYIRQFYPVSTKSSPKYSDTQPLDFPHEA